MGNVIQLSRGGKDALSAEFKGRELYDLAWAMMHGVSMMRVPAYGDPVVLSRVAENGSVVKTSYCLD